MDHETIHRDCIMDNYASTHKFSKQSDDFQKMTYVYFFYTRICAITLQTTFISM